MKTNKQSRTANPREGEESDFQSYHFRFKCPVFNKKSKGKQRNRKVWPTQRKKYKLTKTVPEKDLMVDLLDKDFNTTILKMLKELKEDVEKVKKIMYEQNRNINKQKTQVESKTI